MQLRTSGKTTESKLIYLLLYHLQTKFRSKVEWPKITLATNKRNATILMVAFSIKKLSFSRINQDYVLVQQNAKPKVHKIPKCFINFMRLGQNAVVAN